MSSIADAPPRDTDLRSFHRPRNVSIKRPEETSVKKKLSSMTGDRVARVYIYSEPVEIFTIAGLNVSLRIRVEIECL